MNLDKMREVAAEAAPVPAPVTDAYTEMVKRNVKRWRDEQDLRQQKQAEFEAKRPKPLPNQPQL